MVCSQNNRPNDKSTLQSLLDDALGDYAKLGFHLEEIGDHELRLYHNDTLVGAVNQESAFRHCIPAACRGYLIKTNLDKLARDRCQLVKELVDRIKS